MLSDEANSLLLMVHALATLAMVGIIWFVQVVHYPLFLSVPPDAYPAYQREHMSRTSLVVAPLMLAEAATAIAILLLGIASPDLAIPGLALLGTIWLSTFLVQVPRHAALERAADARIITSLVRTNWLRTVAWTARGVLALLMLRPSLN
ncbi:MAG: hypothetical protein KF838_04980 [Phycisphaeraceae bacterium]|nr:MAG: hypothetical protein KF838_04980 [Phycisphaeraceae bacterium]